MIVVPGALGGRDGDLVRSATASAVAKASTSSSGVSSTTVVVLVMLAVAVGAAAGWLLGRRRSNAVPDGAPAAHDEAGASPPPEGRDREAPLIAALMEERDGAPRGSLRSERIGSALAAAGVETIDPLNETFDPARHQMIDSEMTDDRMLWGRVQYVEQYGYMRDGSLIRFPRVVVWAQANDGGRS